MNNGHNAIDNNNPISGKPHHIDNVVPCNSDALQIAGSNPDVTTKIFARNDSLRNISIWNDCGAAQAFLHAIANFYYVALKQSGAVRPARRNHLNKL